MIGPTNHDARTFPQHSWDRRPRSVKRARTGVADSLRDDGGRTSFPRAALRPRGLRRLGRAAGAALRRRHARAGGGAARVEPLPDHARRDARRGRGRVGGGDAARLARVRGAETRRRTFVLRGAAPIPPGGRDARADIAAGGGAAGAVVGGARGRRLDEAARMDDGRAPRGAHGAARHRAGRRVAADGGRAGRLTDRWARRSTAAVAGRPAAEGIDPAGEEHVLFVVDGEREVGAIRAALARETLYMADGHHRYESALGHREVRRRRAGSPGRATSRRTSC